MHYPVHFEAVSSVAGRWIRVGLCGRDGDNYDQCANHLAEMVCSVDGRCALWMGGVLYGLGGLQYLWLSPEC